MAKLEWALEHHEGAVKSRLDQGAQHFSKLENALEQLKPKPKTLQIVGVGFGIVTFIGALIWQAARYPDRTEFDQAIRSLQHENRATAEVVNKVQMDSILMQKNIEAIQESQDREERNTDAIREKLDKLIISGARR